MNYLNLKNITALHRDEIMEAVTRVVDSGWYLQGEETARFEQEYAAYVGTKHCVSCGNGLDALTLIFRAYKELGVLRDGDEVIVPANTYIASILSITENSLKPVLVEPRGDTLQLDETRIEEAVTPRTRALLLVHLYGRNAWTPGIQALCDRHQFVLVEDNAQAAGCFNSQFAGANGYPIMNCELRIVNYNASAHSFYPGKNLGALGDAGAVATNDNRLAEMVRSLGNYGSSEKYVFPYLGRNSRMDEIQAAVLRVKLKYLDEENLRRKTIAGHYYTYIDNPAIVLPGKAQWEMAAPLAKGTTCRDESCVYHIFPVLCEQRDELQQYLETHGVGTMIHYPIPPHRQACYKEWSNLSFPITEHIHHTELSIPCNPTMTDGEVEEVCRLLNAFRR